MRTHVLAFTCSFRQHGVCAGVTEQSMAEAEDAYVCEECNPQPDLYPGHAEGATFPVADAAVRFAIFLIVLAAPNFAGLV